MSALVLFEYILGTMDIPSFWGYGGVFYVQTGISWFFGGNGYLHTNIKLLFV